MPRTLVAVVLLALATLVALPITPVAAETTVRVKGNVVIIEMTVDIVDGKGQTGPDGSPLVDYWTKILDDTWGAAFNRLPYKNCFKLELQVKLNARGPGFDSKDGNHRILVGAATGGGSFEGTGLDGADETTRNPKTGDGTRSFENDRDGAIPVDAPPTVVAHEFGHLMGLGDDRENGRPKNGRDGTMMVGGVPGVDVNVVQTIDQNLVDRIGKAVANDLANHGKNLPKCEAWNGTLRADHTVASGACTFTWTGSYDFGVLDDRVFGTGLVTPSSACGIAGPVTITGEADDNGFTLSSDSYLLAAGTQIEKTATDRATGTSEYHDAYNDIITTFEMQCQKNCDDEPVG